MFKHLYFIIEYRSLPMTKKISNSPLYLFFYLFKNKKTYKIEFSLTYESMKDFLRKYREILFSSLDIEEK